MSESKSKLTGGKKNRKPKRTTVRKTKRKPKRKTVRKSTTKRKPKRKSVRKSSKRKPKRKSVRKSSKRKPKRKIKRKSGKRKSSRKVHRGGNPETVKFDFIRSPIMDTPLHKQLDPSYDVNGFLADHYLNSDIDKIKQGIYGAAVNRVYNTQQNTGFTLGIKK